MHVTLISPALVSSDASFSIPMTPPLGLAYIAGTLLKNSIDVTVIDAIGEDSNNIVREGGYIYQGLTIEDVILRIPSNTSIIGVSCMFTQDWPYTRRLIQNIRQSFPETMIISGGEHITALFELSLRECPELDYCVLGEGEETMTDIALHVNDRKSIENVDGIVFIRDNICIQTSPRKRIRVVDEIALPAWDLFPIEAHLSSKNSHGVSRGRSMPILSTRGCPYECTFCSNPVMYGRLWLARKPGIVLDEIEHYIRKYHADNIDFYDLTMVIRKDWILEFCNEIEKRKLKFTWQLPSGTRSEVIDEEVACALYRTGCRNLTYAPESGSRETLRIIKKKVNLQNLSKSVCSALRQGISVKCNIIIGFPHDTYRQLFETYLFACRLAIFGVHDIPFYIFSPYPGSELFEIIRSKHFPDGLDEKYYRSLVAYMDLKEMSNYCDHVGPRTLNVFRIIGMSTTYGLAFLLRPWRFIKLITNLIKNKSETVLEQRIGGLFRVKN